MIYGIKTMRFHYNNNGKAICGKDIDVRYLSTDWSMIDCQKCNSHKS